MRKELESSMYNNACDGDAILLAKNILEVMNW